MSQFKPDRAPFLAAYAALVYAFLYFPIVVLIIYSFNGSGVGGFPRIIGRSIGTANCSRIPICGRRFSTAS